MDTQTCLDMARKLAKVLKVPSLLCPLEVFTDGMRITVMFYLCVFS